MCPAVDFVLRHKRDFVIIKFDPMCFVSFLVGLDFTDAEIVATRRSEAVMNDHAVQVVLVLLKLVLLLKLVGLIFVRLA